MKKKWDFSKEISMFLALSVLEFWRKDLDLPDFVTIITTSTKIDKVKVNLLIPMFWGFISDFVGQNVRGGDEVLWDTPIWVSEIQISEEIWGGWY